MQKKADVATDITAIKNDYVTNASLSSQLNDLKSQHVATEVTGIDNKAKANVSDILALEIKLTQEGDTINENERELSIFRGFFFYLQKNHLLYECKVGSFIFSNEKKFLFQQNNVLTSSNDHVLNKNVVNI